MFWTPVCVCVHVPNVSEDQKLPFGQLCCHIGRDSTGHLANPVALGGVVPFSLTPAGPSGPHFGQNAALLQAQEDTWGLSLLCSVAPLVRGQGDSLWSATGSRALRPPSASSIPNVLQVLQKPAWKLGERLTQTTEKPAPLPTRVASSSAVHDHRDLWSHAHSNGHHPVSLNTLNGDQGPEMIRQVPFTVV